MASIAERGVRFQDPSLGNSAPWIYVWNMWALVACLGFTGLRLWIRAGRYGYDDLSNAISCIVSVASTSVLFGALSKGLGVAGGLPLDAQCDSVARLVIVSICLLLVADGFSKCSTLLLIRRIVTSGASPTKLHRIMCDTIMVVVGLWVVVSLALLGSRCHDACSSDNCPPRGSRMVAVIVLCIFVELVIFAVAVSIFNQLQMSFRLKMTTFSLFAMRLPLIAFSVVFLVEYKHYIRSVDRGAEDVGSGPYWQSVFLALTIIAPTLQSLKTTAEKMSTYGAQVGGSTHASGSSHRMKDFSSGSSKKRSGRQGSESHWRLRPEEGANEIHIFSDTAVEGREDGFGPDGMSIRQERAVDVSVSRSS